MIVNLCRTLFCISGNVMGFKTKNIVLYPTTSISNFIANKICAVNVWTQARESDRFQSCIIILDLKKWLFLYQKRF